jgi:hypothetical protein
MFCQNLIAGGMNATGAYRAAGYKGRGNSAEAGASEILRNPKVAARIAELQSKYARKVEKTVADIVADLDRLRDEALARGQTGAGVQAVMGMAKLLGLVIDKAEITAILRKPLGRRKRRLHSSCDEVNALPSANTGWLNYDSNGSAAGGAVHLVHLTPNLALTASRRSWRIFEEPDGK